jgi:VWFA-related protein
VERATGRTEEALALYYQELTRPGTGMPEPLRDNHWERYDRLLASYAALAERAVGGTYGIPGATTTEQRTSEDEKPPEASPNQESDVVKISTKLVQLDLIVVDKDGKQVRNLAASDFTVLEDGKPQKITNLSYVNTSAGPSAEPVKLKEKVKDAPLAPPVKITPANAGRMITFIVDDGNCSASYTGMNASRQGIEKFIREQMQPTDRVAIYQTRAGTSTFQQYTNDKARLLKIAGKIHWRPSIGSCSSNDGSFFPAARSNTFIKQSTSGPSTQTIETDSVRKTREHLEDTAANNQIDGTLGVIRYVLQGLKRVPGRKMVFLLSVKITGSNKYHNSLKSISLL